MPELNTLSTQGIIELLSIDLTPFGGVVQRFINSTDYADALPEDGVIPWQGANWTSLPFQTGGYQRGGENLVRPGVQVFDPNGVLFVGLRDLPSGGHGARVIRYMALAADVLSNNPAAVFRQEEYVINSVRRQDHRLDLELATHIDFAHRGIPGYRMMREDYPGLGSALLR